MDRYIIGIDPGFKGGLAVLNTTKNKLFATNTPVFEGENRTEYDIHAMSAMLNLHPDSVVMTYLERVGARPGQGVTSMFRFGMGFGIWQGIIIARGFPLTLVTPQRWKKEYGLHEDKEASRQKASELFPQCTSFWKRKKDDGVAESALLTHYGSTEMHLPLGNIAPHGSPQAPQLLLG